MKKIHFVSRKKGDTYRDILGGVERVYPYSTVGLKAVRRGTWYGVWGSYSHDWQAPLAWLWIVIAFLVRLPVLSDGTTTDRLFAL